jgi:hypothetical protein
VTRLVFGGGIADWAFGAGDNNLAEIIGGAVLKFYNAETGGARYTDLQEINGTAIDQVTTSNGDDGRSIGQIPPFYGPDNVFELWASANDGPRVLMCAVTIGSYLGPVRDQLTAHLNPANRNPHATTLATLADTDADSIASAPTGSTIVKDASGLWVAGAAATGGGATPAGAVGLTTDEEIRGSKTFDTYEATKPRIVVRAKSTGQTSDVMVAYSGTDTGQGGERQRTFYLNEKGELRAIAAKANSVAFRLKGQPGQTANIFEVTDTGNNAKAWYGPNYAHYAPNSGFAIQWVDEGDIATSSGTFGWVNDLDVDVSMRSFRASLVTPYGSGSLVLNPRVVTSTNISTDLFASGSRPTIPAGSKTTGKLTNFASAIIPVGAMVLVDVITIGAGNVGKGLFAQAMVA